MANIKRINRKENTMAEERNEVDVSLFTKHGARIKTKRTDEHSSEIFWIGLGNEQTRVTEEELRLLQSNIDTVLTAGRKERC